MNKITFDELEIAVLIPCYNEGKTIANVVSEFRQSMPTAKIYVFDNNSIDNTKSQALQAGAHVETCRRQGKGNVVRTMFADVDADIYIMVDGDGTYNPKSCPELVKALICERVDMVVGTRRGIMEYAGRRGHAFGNLIFNNLYYLLFGSDFSDIFSGYRVFTRRFAKSFPSVSQGFEIETEMSVHASLLRLPVTEIELDYSDRVEGSESKLDTFRDGTKILMMFATLVRETKPFAFFTSIAIILLIAGISFMLPVLSEYFSTGLVNRLPTWILSLAMLQGAGLLVLAGLILDSVARGRVEAKRNQYLTIPALPFLQ